MSCMVISGANTSLKHVLALSAFLVALGASTRVLGIEAVAYEEQVETIDAPVTGYEPDCD